MDQYQTLIKEVRELGVRTPNRTGIDAIKLDGAMMRFDLKKGFPATTTKKLAFKSVVGEACAFFRAARSAADFRALGCKVWDDNANNHNPDGSRNAWLDNPFREGTDDLGPIYGVQWREWPCYKLIPCIDGTEPKEVCARTEAIGAKLHAEGWTSLGHVNVDGVEHALMFKEVDQLADCLRKIIKDPNNRRILFHGWNPAVLDQVALPACHVLYQFLPNVVTGELNMTMYVRSNDIGLGTPFNQAEGAIFVEVMARLSGMRPGRLTYFIGDAHIYANQFAYLDELCSKEPYPLPTLKINDRIPSYDPADNKMFLDESGDTQIEHLVEWLKLIEPSDFELVNYQYHTLNEPVPKMVI